MLTNRAPFITSTPPTTASVGDIYTYRIVVSAVPAATLQASGLPGWLQLNGDTLSGVPAQIDAGTTSAITISGSNGLAPNAVQTFTITVNAPAAITSTAPTTALAGTLYTYTIAATGTPSPTISASGLPGWLSLNGNVLSGTPAATDAGPNGPITIAASNGLGAPVTQTFSITVNAPPSFTSAAAATAVAGTAFSYTITTQGFPAPTINAAGLPGWLMRNGNVLSGTPARTDAGVGAAIAITASNGFTPNATLNLVITVNASPLFTNAAPTAATEGVQYTYTATVSGFPTTTFTISGNPTWLMQSGANGQTFSGTPGAADVGVMSNVTITASNGVSPNASQNFTLTVAAANQAPVFQNTPPATATAGVQYNHTITATGNPAPTFTLSGTPPAWLMQSGANGEILSGTPARTDMGVGPQFTITASNGVGTPPTQQVTITVNASPEFTSTPILTATVGQLYTYSPLTASGFPAGMTFTLTQGPLWLMQTAPDTLSGTPQSGDVGTPMVTVTASNGISPDATQNFMITVSAANVAPDITNTPPATATVGQQYMHTITATGNPTPMFTLTNNPLWLQLNGAVLSGTPQTGDVGLATGITITASNGVNPDDVQMFDIDVRAAPDITSTAPPTATVGQQYTYTVVATGTPTPMIMVSGLPASGWLVQSGTNGEILSGTPQSTDVGLTGVITVTAMNGVSPDDMQMFQIDVQEAPDITSTPPPTATVGVQYTYTIAATGTPPPTFSVSGNPAWLQLAGNVLSGTPNMVDAGPTAPITVTAMNGVTPDDTQTFTVTVNAPNIVQFTFAGVTGISGPRNAEVVAANLNPTVTIDRVGLTATSATAAFSSSNWPVAAQGTAGPPDANNKYLTFTVTPNAGFQLSLSRLELDEERSLTGPREWTVRSSVDGFASNLATFTVPDNDSRRLNQQIVFDGLTFSNLTTAVTFRIYGYNAEGTGGTWRVAMVELVGFVLPVPILTEGFEGGVLPAGWASNVTGGAPATPDWEFGTPTTTGPRAPFTGTGVAATILDGKYNSSDVGGRLSTLQTPVLDFTGVTRPAVRFHHYYESEMGFDGGNLQISTNGGANFVPIAAAAVTPAYDGIVSALSANPQTGLAAWFGESTPAPTAPDAVWRQVDVNLAANLAGQPVNNVIVRFDFGADDLISGQGWYIDEVSAGELASLPAPKVPIITSAPDTTATDGVAYNYTITATGSPTPTITTTGLPAWLAQNGNTLTGTPGTTDVGFSSRITVTASNGRAPNAVQTFTIQVFPASGPPPVLMSEGFESAVLPSGWGNNFGPGTASDWEFGTPSGATPLAGPVVPPQGTSCAGTQIDGNYTTEATGRRSSLDTPSFDFTGVASPAVRFQHFFFIERDTTAGSFIAFDGANVKISTNGGLTFRPLDPASVTSTLISYNRVTLPSSFFSNPLGDEFVWAGLFFNPPQFRQVDIDLTGELVGKPLTNVVIRFDFGSDDDVSLLGWYVDDVLVGDGAMFP